MLLAPIMAFSTEGPFPLTAQRLVDLIAGPAAASGTKVNEQTALGLAACWACVRIISETVGALPLHLYEDLQGGGRQKATSHPIYSLLHDNPNPWMTPLQFRETLTAHAVFRGNGFAEIERDARSMPINLWPLRPDRMLHTEVSAAGTLLYYYQHSDGSVQQIPQRNLFHLRGLASDGLSGYSPLTIHRETLGMGLALQEHGARFFGQGARPGGVLKAKTRLSKDAADRLRDSWQSSHGGLSQSHRVAVLEEGIEWQQVGMSQEDAQFLETKNFTEQDIARIFRVPQHKIGHMEQATFSNIEKQAIEFVTDTILPWCVRWEQQLDKDVVPPADRGRYYTKHVIDGLLRGDIATRYAAYEKARLGGWMNGDEIRELENQNPTTDGSGSIYWRPSNMEPAGTLAPVPTGAAA